MCSPFAKPVRDNADSARRFVKMVRREWPARVQGQKVSAAELQVLFKAAAYLLDTSENIDADLSPIFTQASVTAGLSPDTGRKLLFEERAGVERSEAQRLEAHGGAR